VAWHPRSYAVDVLYKFEQLLHCWAVQLSTQRHFQISFGYGFNKEQQRTQLWTDLVDMTPTITDAWCILGDFNSILYKEDRIGGDAVTEHATREFHNCIDQCELHELTCSGPYYSWTNKSIWSRIDRVFINNYWLNHFDFTHIKYLANGLSDHTTLLVHFPSSQKTANFLPILWHVVFSQRFPCTHFSP